MSQSGWQPTVQLCIKEYHACNVSPSKIALVKRFEDTDLWQRRVTEALTHARNCVCARDDRHVHVGT